MNKNDSRRKLLKSIVAGSGTVVAGKSLPESWRKPVIDAVVLPAHARTSEENDSGENTTTTTTTTTAAPVAPVGPFVASADAEESVYLNVNTTDGSFTVRVGTSPTQGTESLRFEYAGPSAFRFAEFGGIWDSATNTGTQASPDYPPGGSFSSTLVAGSNTFILNAIVGESTSGEITVNNLTIVKS